MEPSAPAPKGDFTLSDFKRQLGQVAKLGPINRIMSMIPGMAGLAKKLGSQTPEADLRRLIGIIDSMTPEERRAPSTTVNRSRETRIAAGAGVAPYEVRELLRQFDKLSFLMKKMWDILEN